MISQRKNTILLFVFLPIFLLSLIGSVNALETPTHKEINTYISKGTSCGFSLNNYLIKQLGMPKGYDEKLSNKEVYLWISDGGEKEDSYLGLRFLNHFHDPISNTGLAGQYSARQWALMDAGSQSVLFENYSWYDARNYYYTALTGLDKLTKETHYAKTFRALGQVMHLVQDMSVPEHTREDQHLFGSDYEEWFLKPTAPDITSYIPHKFFEPSASYPLSITNLFDTEQYNGTNPDITSPSTSIGLSEYSNANFLSPHNIFTGYAYPAYADMSDQIVNNTLYLVQKGDEGTEKYLARAQNFYKYLPSDYKKLALTTNDNKVHTNYANILIPRAIGYSSQALSYFFRGELDVDAVPIIIDDYIWGIAFFITNITQTEEALAQGGIFHPKYEPATGSPEVDITALQLDLAYNEKTLVPLWFDQPIIIWDDLATFRDAVCTIAFKGGLGSETEAVIGKVFKLETALNFNEDWYSLAGNYPWDHTTADDLPDNGATINEVLNGVLIKDNIRFADTNDQDEKARYNITSLNLMNAVNPNGIPITSSTYIEYKIDDMSIVNKPEATPGYTSDYQVVNLFFNNGLIIELFYDAGISMSATTAYWTFSPGGIMLDNIYEIFQAYSIAIPEPLYLESIYFTQQLLPSPDSPLDTSQHMKVDYFRIIDGKTSSP